MNAQEFIGEYLGNLLAIEKLNKRKTSIN